MQAEARVLKHVLILAGLSYVFFVMGNGLVALINPDEVFYAQTAKEMARHGTWMVPYLFDHPQFEKPILTYWLLRAGFGTLGLSSFSARLFPALFATIGVIATYFLALLGFKSERKALLSSVILMSSGLYVGLARTLYTDMIFSTFILLALLSFFWLYSREGKGVLGVLLFSVFSGLAVLTKGPLGFLVPALTVLAFLGFRKELNRVLSRRWLWGLLIFAVVASPWYIFMTRAYGNGFVQEFFYNCHVRRIFEAEHPENDRWYFYLLTMTAGMFPWSIYVAASLVRVLAGLRRGMESVYLFLFCWAAVVFLIFQPAHSKLVSYVFPMFPALAMLSGGFICDAALETRKGRILSVSLATALILFLLPVSLLVVLARWHTMAHLSVPVYVLSVLWLVIALAFSVLLFRGKFLVGAYVLALVIPAAFSVAPLVKEETEAYQSSRPAVEYLLSNHDVNSVVLCSKSLVRGVRFYSDKDVAVVDIGGAGFFSPHPIPFLDTESKVRDFLFRQGLTYCVVNERLADDLERIAGRGFEFEVLAAIGNKHILKIRRL